MAATYVETAFAGPAALPLVETVAYAGPGGTKTAVLRSVRFVNTTGAAITFGLSIGRGGAAGVAGNRIIPDATSVPAGATYTDELREVLGSGDTLSWKASAAGLIGSLAGLVRTS